MNVEVFNSDDPNHHRMGKDLLHSCPSEPPSAQSGNSSSPITQSPQATISPPVKQSLHKLLGFLKWLSIFRPSKHTSPSIVNLNYYFIENRTIENNNNLSYNNAMKIISQVLNNYGTIQENNFYGKNEQQSNENEGKEDVEDVDHTEVVEVKPVKASVVKPCHPNNKVKNKDLTFNDCIAEKETAHILRKWLHQMMDPISSKNAKEKLIFLRSVSEAGTFSQQLTYKVYLSEFGQITKSCYYYWMKNELRYDRSEIDKLYEVYLQFLAQFRK